MQYIVFRLKDEEEQFWTGDMDSGMPRTSYFATDAKKFNSARLAYDAAGRAAESEVRMGRNQISLLDFKVRQLGVYERRLEADALVNARIKAFKASATEESPNAP